MPELRPGRPCLSCGAEISPVKRRGTKYCSPECGSRAWREANTDKCRADHLSWRSKPENAAKVISRVKLWRINNPDKFWVNVRQYVGNRRARKQAAPIRDFTAANWRELLVEYSFRCFYCGASGVPLEQEHKIPLSRGGSHTKSNIVPSCKSCNCRKSDKTAEEFLGGRA